MPPKVRSSVTSPIVVVLAAMLGVAACAGATQSAYVSELEPDGPVVVNKDGVNAEYEATADELEWPIGVTPPPRPDDSVGGAYEVGVGEGDAVIAWNCAWGREWLRVRDSDPEAASTALDIYASIVDTPAFKKYFDPESDQPVTRDIIDKARLGDPSGVRRDVEANCPTDAP